MTTAAGPPASTGTTGRKCDRCQEPVPAGTGVLITVDQGTTASPDILIHPSPCVPPHVRRNQR